jgi:L-ascorbate metabolism protein UlaG (beta-lactamase superfamily)
MDRFAEKQDEIARRRVEICIRYPALWSKMIAQWKRPGSEDRAWLMYSANYLFRTNNVRWALDPLTLRWRLKDAPQVNALRDLKSLSFVLLTHRHEDHLDLDLLFELQHLPVTWVIPEFLLSEVVQHACLPREKILIPSPLVPIELNGVRILPFDGLHWESSPDGARRGVPAMGYLIECKGKRWLFPGDTRSYYSPQLPRFENVDVAFAHLWLGRGAALANQPPLLEAFCQFFLDLGVHRVVLTHLHELGRDADDYWDDGHVQLVDSRFREMSVNLQVHPLLMGKRILL